jgi:tRNA-(ms[2]io[6]A)-hydroxylase
VTKPPADDKLPLLSRTPSAWAGEALKDPLALLNDHAHLEKKAALNVLELLHRRPEEEDERWTAALTAVARDETAHLHTVAGLLARRDGRLSRGHKNPYAQDLHGLVRRGRGPEELADRLLISALIEARSCERFGVLAETGDDKELARLYRSLRASEFGHHAVFLRLAAGVLPAREVDARWRWMLAREAEIIARQPPGPRMHSGPP